jgi:uncharacterized protein
MSSALDTVRAIYDAFGKGDIPSVLGAMKSDIRWVEAEGGPYGGIFTGPQAVLDNVFMKLGSEWDGFAAVPREFVADGNVVVALGEYSATYKGTGKGFKAPFAHVWRLDGDRVAEFQQYTDTHIHRQPMQ